MPKATLLIMLSKVQYIVTLQYFIQRVIIIIMVPSILHEFHVYISPVTESKTLNVQFYLLKCRRSHKIASVP